MVEKWSLAFSGRSLITYVIDSLTITATYTTEKLYARLVVAARHSVFFSRRALTVTKSHMRIAQ
jgi:hypothetical protein